jgi:hypothetical protein
VQRTRRVALGTVLVAAIGLSSSSAALAQDVGSISLNIPPTGSTYSAGFSLVGNHSGWYGYATQQVAGFPCAPYNVDVPNPAVDLVWVQAGGLRYGPDYVSEFKSPIYFYDTLRPQFIGDVDVCEFISYTDGYGIFQRPVAVDGYTLEAPPPPPPAPAPTPVSPSGGSAPTTSGGTAGDSAEFEPLTASEAKTEARSGLASRLGVRWRRGASRRLSCAKLSTNRFSCRVSFKYRRAAYRGTVTVSLSSTGRLSRRVNVRKLRSRAAATSELAAQLAKLPSQVE